jgi:hypothetical protein
VPAAPTQHSSMSPASHSRSANSFSHSHSANTTQQHVTCQPQPSRAYWAGSSSLPCQQGHESGGPGPAQSSMQGASWATCCCVCTLCECVRP